MQPVNFVLVGVPTVSVDTSVVKGTGVVVVVVDVLLSSSLLGHSKFFIAYINQINHIFLSERQSITLPSRHKAC